MKGFSRALRALFGSCTDASHLTVAAHGSGLIPGQAVEPTPLTSQWPPTDRGCLRAPGTGSCTHAAHLTVAAHGPELFEGSRDRLSKLALKKLYESRRNHDLGAILLAALLPHCCPPGHQSSVDGEEPQPAGGERVRNGP